MTSVPLSEWASIKLDGSGNGTVRLGPNAHGVIWRPTVASIKMSGSIPDGVTTCYVYAGGSVSDGNFVDSTYDVSNDSTDRVSGQALQLGQSVFAVWSNGNPNATATLSVSGTKDIP
jgi:hypothetical protein